MKRFKTRLIVLLLTVCLLAGMALPVHATELKTGIGVVTASSLRLRAKPNTDAEILATAVGGDCVVIIREVDDWYLVNYNLEIGYMAKEYVEFNEKKNVKLGFAMFDSSSNVRGGPGTDSDIVARAPKGETCFIIGFNSDWYKVSFNGQIGYVRSDLLTLLEIPYSNFGSKGNTYHEDGAAAAESKPEESKPAESSKSSSESKSSEQSKSSSKSSSDSKSSSSSSSSSSASSGSSNSSTASTLGERVAAYALQFKGYRYVYGGATPSGFDCSGMVYYIYKQFGYNVGRICTAQLSAGKHVTRGNLMPGDIVVFERTYTTSSRATHSGIYIGNGQFIHAANTKLGVIVSSIDNEYYASRLICGVRVG
ncbi:MAG: C40 family peptidase [Oscillospiraceae bacterium]|nr:C40 family peptidase [Oscillospiraceae bacterium]